MKTVKLLLVATLLAASTITSAQVTASLNFGTPPAWAPKNAEPTRYYYLPEIETYYDVPSKRYIYMRDGKWFRSAALPAHYRNYNLYKGKTVYLKKYKGNYPYYYFDKHKVKYNNGNKTNYKQSSGNHKGKSHGNGNGNKQGNKKGKDKK